MATQLSPITEPSLKPSPQPSKAGFRRSTYQASPDGADSNLLIMLHGLGDTDKPFAQLGQQVQRTLPQCAVLSLRGQLEVPLLGGGMWWEAWDPLGETQNPSKFIECFIQLLEHLIKECAWPPKALHVLGFGQGATAALEGLYVWAKGRKGDQCIGSVVAVCAGMLSHPTSFTPLAIPVLHATRSSASSVSSDLRMLQRAFTPVVQLKLASGPDSMPRGAEWADVVKFWGTEPGRWRNRSTWERSGEVYTVAK